MLYSKLISYKSYLRKIFSLDKSSEKQQNDPLRYKSFDLISLALWFGLVAGIGEVILFLIRKYYLHRILDLSLHTLWMAPVATSLLLLSFGLLFYTINQFRSNSISLRIYITIYVFICLLGWGYLFARLHPISVFVLSLGIGVQVSILICWQYDVFKKIMQRTLPIFGGVVVLLYLGLNGVLKYAESQKISNLSQSTSDSPNVLLIVLDTVRAENLSLYGYDRNTSPYIDNLATRGVVFDYAIAPSSWTLPSHATLFSGMHPHEFSVNWTKPLDDTYPLLSEYLSRNGYATAGFIANTLYLTYEYGFSRGFSHYEDFPISTGQLVLSSSIGRKITECWRGQGLGCTIRRLFRAYQTIGRKDAKDVNEGILRWINQNDRPFFVFLNYFDAHDPYLPPSPFDNKFGQTTGLPRPWYVDGYVVWEWTDKEIQIEIDAYDGAISYLDYRIGELISELENMGKLENTFVIITSDHGEEFGEHGDYLHGYNLYYTSTRIPLILIYPNSIPSATNISSVVSLRDVPATILDILGLSDGAPFPGSSLARFWENSSGDSPEEMVLSHLSLRSRSAENLQSMFSLIDNQRQYIRNVDGNEELYAFRQDPLEQINISDLSTSKPILKEFRDAIKYFISSTETVQGK